MLWKTMRYWMASVLAGLLIASLALNPATAAEGTAESDTEAEPSDPYAVPDGTLDELVEFIDGILGGGRPPNAEAYRKAMAAMEEAADKILAGKPNDEQAQKAVNVMFGKSAEELEALVKTLKKAGLKKAARAATAGMLQRRLGEAARPGGSAKQLGKTIDSVKAHLSEGPLGPSDARLAMMAGQMTERSGNTKLAVETYTALGKILAAAKAPGIAEQGAMMQGVVRRLTLRGKDMKVEGALLGGDALDWASYRGKVVLIDFWATWCGPCIGEIPNVKKQYEAYHDRGFEIVGISIDRDREALEDFIEEREIPWTIVHDENGRSPTAKYYGVMGIPTMILVGKDGKVVSTKARGEELNEQLEKLLGPAEDESDEPEESK